MSKIDDWLWYGMGEGYDMHSFCVKCGRHRRRMSFGSRSEFFDSAVCAHCGAPGAGYQTTARMTWKRGWIDTDGVPIDAVGQSRQSW